MDIAAGRSQDRPDKSYSGGIMGKQLVIVGAGAGGASVAAEAKRKDPNLSIVMIEKEGYVSATT